MQEDGLFFLQVGKPVRVGTYLSCVEFDIIALHERLSQAERYRI